MIAIIGSEGMLGKDVVAYCNDNNIDYRAFNRLELDITNMSLVRKKITKEINVIINCAAYVSADKAEKEVLKAMKVNGLGPRNLALVAKEINAEIIHISTDYVFDGLKKEGYDEMDLPNPINVYGKSKMMGENFIKETTNKYYILRTAWLFGHGGNNFIKTMISLAGEGEIRVVNDQVGTPTYTRDLVDVIFKMIGTKKYGTYHVTSEGKTTWYEFARYIFNAKGLKVNLIPCRSEEYPVPAKRPINSELKSLMLEAEGFNLLPHWKESVNKYFDAEDIK